MKNLNSLFCRTRFLVTEIKTALIILVFLTVSSCTKRSNKELNNIPAYRTDISQAEVLDYSSVTTNVTLNDRVNGVDYIIKNDLQVTSGNLTIKPGVTIMFENGTGILVNEGGSFTAIGEPGNEIYFVSRSNKRGDWKGITILSNAAANVISYCHIEHGGNASNIYGQANLIIGSGDKPAGAEVSHNEIMTSASTGIIISEGSEARWFASNTISTNTDYPVSTHITNAGSLQNGNIYRDNGKEFIELTGNGNNLVTKPAVLNNLNEPFALSGNIATGRSITINAGARIYMNSGAKLTIDGTGSLSAIGTAVQPILLTGVYDNSGLWNSINFKSSASPLNRLEHCQIIDGGGAAQGHEGMINFISPNGGLNQIVIRNCNISNSAATGIYLQKGLTQYNVDIETSNTFTGNKGANIYYDTVLGPE